MAERKSKNLDIKATSELFTQGIVGRESNSDLNIVDDPDLEYDPTPGPFVISPLTAGRYKPRPGQLVVKGL